MKIFLGTITAFLALSLAFVLAACNGPSAAQVQADGNAIATAINSIASLEQATDPGLAAKLAAAAQALQAATANWQTGSTIADIQTAANVVTTVLSAIPQTAMYAPLVAIATAAVEVLIANISNQPVPTSAKSLVPHRFGRSVEGDFKAAWNTQSAALHAGVKF